MNETNELYREYKEHKKKIKNKRMISNIDFLKNKGIFFKEVNQGYQLILSINSTRIDIYPSTDLVMIKGKKIRGVKKFINTYLSRGEA